MQLNMYICLWFPIFSVVSIMLLKMYYIVICAIVLPLKTSSHWFIVEVIRCKMVGLVVINSQAYFLHISISLFVNLP